MKTLLIIFTVLFCTQLSAQSKHELKIIQTSAECESCKERLEKELNYTKGIQFAELDVPSKKLTVKFNASKITLKEIYFKINYLGYDADEMKADKKAQSELPKCCLPGGMEGERHE